MRNALLLISLFSSIVLFAGQQASAAGFATPTANSIYAPSTAVPGSTILNEDQLLPVRGSELPLPTAAASGTARGPQDSIVEAIPTPTAFHAGLFLLAAILAIRYVRKLRII